VVSHDDALPLFLLLLTCEAQLLSVLDHGGDVLRVQRVHDGEEVRAVGQPVLGQLVREVHPEVWLRPPGRQHGLDGQLVVLGHDDGLDVGQPHQPLLVLQDVAEEVLVEHGVGRQVQLHWQGHVTRGRGLTDFAEVCFEVGLGSEAVDDLVGLEGLDVVTSLAEVRRLTKLLRRLRVRLHGLTVS